MTSTLRFTVPVQGEGVQEDQTGIEWSHLYQVVGDANGFSKWSRQKNYVGFSHDSEFAVKLRNLGSGGKHLWIQKSTDASTVLTVTDTGLTASGQITSTVTTASGLAPFVVASTVKVVSLNADLLDDQSGAFYLARGNHTGTQAPATISPQGSGSGLDADTLDGHDTAFFATAASLGSYVLKAGDTMTGLLTMELSSGNDQQIKLKHNSGAGGFFLGSSNSATPDLILKNNAGTQVARVTNTGVFLAGAQTALVSTAGANDAQVNDLWLVASASNFRRVTANGTAFQVSGNADVGTHLTISSGGTMTIPALAIDNNDLTVGTNRFKVDGTGLGFFGATPIGRPAVVGSRGGNAALQSLCDQLADLGLISDLTT